MRRRFVQKQDLRSHCQDAGQSDAPFFPPGKMKRYAPLKAPQPDVLQRFGDALTNLGRSQAQVQRSKSHVVGNRRAEQLIVAILKNDSHHARQGATLTPLRWIQTGDIGGATWDAQNSAQAEKQGCLPGAVWPDQGNTFPLPHFKTDPMQRPLPTLRQIPRWILDQLMTRPNGSAKRFNDCSSRSNASKS